MVVGFDLWFRRLLSCYFLFGDEGLRFGDNAPARIFNLRVDVLITILVLHFFFALGWTSSLDRLAFFY